MIFVQIHVNHISYFSLSANLHSFKQSRKIIFKCNYYYVWR